MGDGEASNSELNAVIDDLRQSGLAVTEHGESLAAVHSASDGTLEAALGGWRGESAHAMLVRSAEWPTMTHELLTRLGAHAEDFHGASRTFLDMVDEHVRALASVQRPAASAVR